MRTHVLPWSQKENSVGSRIPRLLKGGGSGDPPGNNRFAYIWIQSSSPRPDERYHHFSNIPRFLSMSSECTKDHLFASCVPEKLRLEGLPSKTLREELQQRLTKTYDTLVVLGNRWPTNRQPGRTPSLIELGKEAEPCR